ncbi:hypothetical protein Tco_1027728 [Tanacetum coccineum]
MEAHLAPTQPTQVNKVTTLCEICSVPHNTQYCIKDPKAGAKENEEEEKDNPESIHVNPSTPPNLSVAFITEKVLKFNSFFESLGLVPQSSDTEVVCSKGDDREVMFMELIRKKNDSTKDKH